MERLGAADHAFVRQMAQLSGFLQTLKGVVDPTGANLLDNTLVYFSSDCSVSGSPVRNWMR